VISNEGWKRSVMRDAPGDGDVDLDSIVREMAEMECKPPLNFRGVEWRL